MKEKINDIIQDYLTTLQKYLIGKNEEYLHHAYNLGRDAYNSGVNLLEIANIHHTVLTKILEDNIPPDNIHEIITSVSNFYTEFISSFEMALRGFKEVNNLLRELYIELKTKSRKLEAANQELESFSYSVSHDLRAPLRAIDGYTRIIEEDYGSQFDAEGKRICGVIRVNTRQMNQLIDDLLAFSKLSRTEIQSSLIDITKLVNSVFNELTSPENRQRIIFDIDVLPSITGDTAMIKQVWINLISNALKFSSKNNQAEIKIGFEQTDNEIIYFIKDNGVGFDMQYSDKLFGVFQRLHSTKEFEGTGVGLAIVQRIIKRHGGRVWAKGEINIGATFYFSIPIKEANHE